MPVTCRLARALALTSLLLVGCRTAGEPAVNPPAPPAPLATGAPAAEPASTPAPPPMMEPVPAPPALAREFRGVWISPVWSGEWPRAGATPDQHRAELIGLLDRARAAGLNAVVLHVRPAADALYPTARAPWSAYLTGAVGRAPEPAWDPLAFAIAEAHRRGLELHAWFNPFRAAPPDRRVDPPVRSVAQLAPSRVVRYGTQPWIDPGFPDARRAVLDAILEVVERYDVDGIHLDDYFYPYVQQREVRTTVRGRTVRRTENVPFPDSASWERYGRPAGFERRADWRRANIDDFVATLYREVKARRPWVAVGISPFGIWRPGSPPGITGLDAYAEIFADARRWFREGWLDYLAPQLYWPIDGAQQRFTRLDEWWRAENVQRRHLWPGLHTERETAARNAWAPGEIVRQIDTLRAVRRQSEESFGHIHFRLHALRPGDRGGIGESLRARSYAEPALTPASPWLDARPPAAPRVRAIPLEDAGSGMLVSIAAGDTVPVRWWVLQLLDDREQWRTLVRDVGEATVPLPADGAVRGVVVRAVSRTGIAGEGTSLRLP
ncbi:MAG TPA: family 10 glycosylhydrolase [Longimicrobiales bacterium]|nr:family 10 glycosylhydrolase [Longimicrobiales bacterium]